jgi:histidinol dehydrogenase
MRPASLGEAAVFAFFPEAGESFRDLALAFVNEYAPEHLEVHLPDARAFAGEVTSAGAIFLGELTPTAYGDYIAGSNHVLPTGGAARFASPLSVDTFMRKSALVELTPGATRHLVPHLARLAASEGFVFHRLSGELRARGGRTAGENS